MAISYWGVEHGDTVSKANDGKRRNGAVVAGGTYLGAVGGSAGGTLAANARRNGGGFRGAAQRAASSTYEGSMRAGVSAGDRVMNGQKPLRATLGGVKDAFKVKSYARTSAGGVLGAAAGGGLAYSALRNKRQR